MVTAVASELFVLTFALEKVTENLSLALMSPGWCPVQNSVSFTLNGLYEFREERRTNVKSDCGI